MDDLKERLLPRPRPTPNSASTTRLDAGGGGGGGPFSGGGLKKRTGVPQKKTLLRSWIRVDSATGAASSISLDKLTVMRRCDLPARDLRLLDPLFVYPSTILGREKAIVVNLERIRCIITADEVLILAGPSARDVSREAGDEWDYVNELQRRLVARADDLPFEFVALEVALEASCAFLDSQAAELEIEAYPLLDELTSKISTLNLERVRRLKSKLVALTRRVQKVRDEIEQLMDDDGDMAEIYLTEKKLRIESSSLYGGDQQSLQSGPGMSVSAPVSPVSSPLESMRKLEKSISLARSSSRHSSIRDSESEMGSNIEELEMLLEAYFVVIDNTLNKLTSLKEYIDDTEDFINIQLDNVRNQLIQFELLLTTATFVVAIFGVIAGIFGMNFAIPLFDQPNAFQWVLIISGLSGILVFCCFLWFFKHRKLIPL